MIKKKECSADRLWCASQLLNSGCRGGEETIDLEMSHKVVISLKEESSEESEDSSKSDVIVEEESSEPEEIEEAEVVEERGPMNPLTREAMEEDLTGTRPYVFMINNLSGAMPHCGVS